MQSSAPTASKMQVARLHCRVQQNLPKPLQFGRITELEAQANAGASKLDGLALQPSSLPQSVADLHTDALEGGGPEASHSDAGVEVVSYVCRNSNLLQDSCKYMCLHPGHVPASAASRTWSLACMAVGFD